MTVTGPPAAGQAPVLSARELLAAGRDLAVPFRLALDGPPEPSGFAAGAIECVEILRLLPGRRLVARARLAQGNCVVKLFYGARAERYFRRERRGLRCLIRCGVATPAMLASLRLAGGGRGLVLEWLADAKPVAEDDQHGFIQVVAALARLHRGSATQSDPHLGNYLQDPAGRVFAIDGDGVRPWPLLSRRRALANFGLLLAQLPPAADVRLFAACAEYDRVRWQTSVSDVFLAEVRRHLHRQRRARTRRYLAKTLRDCTEFRCEASPGRFLVCERTAWGPALAEFARDPEAAFAAREGRAAAEMLKAGNSATVIRTPIGGQTFVVKRYNVKSLGHGLRRALNPLPRYRRAWRNAHRLAFLRLPSARPVALLELRNGAAATVAYLVMEDLGADAVDLAAWVAAHGAPPSLLDTVARLFRGLLDAELVHADTKASNFLVRGEEVYLIDLDALVEGRHGLARDVARFLANWDHDPVIREQFRAALQAVGMPL